MNILVNIRKITLHFCTYIRHWLQFLHLVLLIKQTNVSFVILNNSVSQNERQRQHHPQLFRRHARHFLLFLNIFFIFYNLFFSVFENNSLYFQSPENNPHIFYYFLSFQEFRLKLLWGEVTLLSVVNASTRCQKLPWSDKRK